MTRETRIWLIVMLLGAAALIGRATFSEIGMGREYVRAVPVADGQWTQYDPTTYGEYVRAEAAQPDQTEFQFSLGRTIGLWAAALFTLAVFSFLFGDNPFYKIAESVLVGVSAAYWMVIAFWDVLVPNLFGKLWPAMVQAWAMPGLRGAEAEVDLTYIVPLVLGGMLLWRLAPKGSWIARWPLAFIIGTTAGLRLVAFLHGDFLAQIRNTILPVVVLGAGGFDFWGSVQNLLIVGVRALLSDVLLLLVRAQGRSRRRGESGHLGADDYIRRGLRLHGDGTHRATGDSLRVSARRLAVAHRPRRPSCHRASAVRSVGADCRRH